MASRITNLPIVHSTTIYSGADQRKSQSSASLAFVRDIYWWPMNSPHKRPVTRKMFPFDDVIMYALFTQALQVCFTGTGLTHEPMTTSSHGSFFRVAGPLRGEFIGNRWISFTKGQLCRIWCFFDVGPHKLLNKKSNDRRFDTKRRSCGVIVMALMDMNKINHHCNLARR